jgi:glycine dehydrogenase subunit 2
MLNQNQSLIFESSKEGRIGYSLPELDVPQVNAEELLGKAYVRTRAS